MFKDIIPITLDFDEMMTISRDLQSIVFNDELGPSKMSNDISGDFIG